MRHLLLLMLLIISCKPSTEKAANADTEEQEVNTTPAVLEEPVFESEEDAKLTLLQGTWNSDEDSASYLKITDDQLFMGYEGVDTGTDTYTITIANQLPNDQASNPDTYYLILTQGDETLTYAIDILNEDSLKLLFLPRGNFLSYSRAQ
ncbi:hypothetical protein [Leeuwenhoekiella marinoflava]|uniref:hypothetical protein n=1 Tax=Leeuwenhoekiella marinoflava TaxID=988 RepID=UPI0030018AC9